MKTVSIVSIVALGGMFVGCTTSQMKSTPFYTGAGAYTGKVEDRVNLWPFGYYREPALSVLWPLFSLTDDHLAVRPVYSQYRQRGKDAAYDEFNFLWPFCQFDTCHRRHHVFPAFWSDDSFDLFPLVWWQKDRYFNVFPLFWSNAERDMLLPLYYRDNDSFVSPLFGWTNDGSWCFPLCYKGGDCLATLPYVTGGKDGESYWASPLLLSWGESSADESYNAFLLGLGGTATGRDNTSCQWVLPFFYHSDTSLTTPLFGYDCTCNGSWIFPCYYNDDDTFLSMAYWRKWSADANGNRTLAHGTFPFWYEDDDTFLSPFWMSATSAGKHAWVVPPALSWGTESAAANENYFLLGLGGYARGTDGEFCDWILPLYYRDNENFVSLPWCRWGGGEAHGYAILPLLTYFNTYGDFFTPVVGKSGDVNWVLPLWWRDGNGFMTLLYGQNRASYGMEYVIPPLLSGWVRNNDGSSALYALLGLGGWKNENGVNKSWMFPLWYAAGDDFFSVPLIHHDDWTSVCLIAGVHHGERKSGAWLWPLFGWKSDAKMAEAEAMLNADKLDAKVAVALNGEVRNGHTNHYDRVEGAVGAHDETWLLSGLGGGDHWIAWSVSGEAGNKAKKLIVGKEHWDYGNVFAFKRESSRRVTFDAKTHEKTGETVEEETGVFCNLLWHSEYENHGKGREHSEKSILWRFWHYENENGDVSVDSFPFFTYDEKKDGYAKTSLLWRLFRYESKPDAGTSVDVLFIPVWR